MNQTECEELVIETPTNPVLTIWFGSVAAMVVAGMLMMRVQALPYQGVSAAVLALIAWWWVTRRVRVVVRFAPKEAVFVYTRWHPFRTHKTVSLQGFTRVYASPFAQNSGWSIHLSGRLGQHLLLAELPSPFKVSMRSSQALNLCQAIAHGLGITNGGDGRRP